jgi:membrane protein
MSLVAAGVAFYGFLALVPLMGATILSYGFIANPQDISRHVTSLSEILPGRQLL